MVVMATVSVCIFIAVFHTSSIHYGILLNYTHSSFKIIENYSALITLGCKILP